MRALNRLRWLLPALAIPAVVVLLGVSLQAAAFKRAPRTSLLATAAVGELMRYHVMRGTEELGRQDLASVCIQGWFHSPRHRRLVRGALVLLGTGERLYDVGNGIQRLTRNGSRVADAVDRARFVLAGCPRFIGDRVGTTLVHGSRFATLTNRSDGRRALTIVLWGQGSRISLAVDSRTYRPVAIEFGNHAVRGWSDLEPGGGKAAIFRVRKAFHLRTVPRRHV